MFYLLCGSKSFFYWFKVIDKDHGVLMRPMPGMVALVPSGSKVNVSLCF